MRRLANLFLILPLLLGAACSNVPRAAGPAEVAIRSTLPRSPGESLLLYYDRIRGLPAAEQARETELLGQAFADDKSDMTRLRYALLLSLPGAGARQHGRAQLLFESVTRDAEGRDPAARALAVLMAAELAERRRLEDSLQATAQRQKEDLAEKKRLEESLQAAVQKQKEEQLRVADLEQKLEALKSIEKSLSQRERKATLPAPATGAVKQ